MSGLNISVAMCTYNGASYLREQLESLASQDRLPQELVVCDDGSTDNTLDIIEDFACSAPFNVLVYKNEKNLGSTRNFEKAIRKCSGEIIFLSDQDDIWIPRKLSVFERVFDMHPESAGVLADAQIVDQSLTPLGYRFWEATDFQGTSHRKAMEGNLDTLVRFNSSMAGATFAFRSAMMDRVLPIPDNWTHDAWIIIVIAALEGIWIVDEPMNLWRQHQRQQLGSWVKKSFAQQKVWTFNKDLTFDATVATEQYFSALGFLETKGFASAKDEMILLGLLDLWKERAHHLNARARMQTESLKRLPTILRELFSARYFRYSSGFKSVARDLFYRA